MEVRINKFLSEAGVCSRREADRQIAAGNVTIDGKTAQMGESVLPGQQVCFMGKPVTKEEEMILIAFHKPKGIVCTAEKREKNNVIDYIHYPKRIYPIGRLDKDSEGLLLLTNNGDIVNKMMRAGNRHEKEYIVTVNRPVTESFLRGLAGGVPLVELNTTTRKCKVWQTGKKEFHIILTQGLNRQIRRMCEYFDYRVQRLVRVRIMNMELGDLEPGTYRDVTSEEYKRLTKLLEASSNLPASMRREKRKYPAPGMGSLQEMKGNAPAAQRRGKMGNSSREERRSENPGSFKRKAEAGHRMSTPKAEHHIYKVRNQNGSKKTTN